MFNTNKRLTMNTEVAKSLIRHLTSTGQIQEITLQFSGLRTNFERVDFVYDLLKEQNLLPDFIVDKKDDKKAGELRGKGNEMFKVKKNEEALGYYTLSVAKAENGSESLALAYANRSAVLFEQKMFAECLVDIERALANNYPSNLQPKLLARQANAQAYLPTQIPLIYHEPLPEIPPDDRHPYLESASKAIEVKTTTELGRHVIAARDINRGEILVVEKPYSKICLEETFSHCHECLTLCYNLLPCEKCTQALYCSEECRKRAFGSYHQYECVILATGFGIGLDKSEIFPTRIALIARAEYEDVDLSCYKLQEYEVYKSDRYKELHNLVANTTHRSPTDLFNRTITAALMYHLIKEYSNFFPKEDPKNITQKFKEVVLLQLQVAACNFHAIDELIKINDVYQTEVFADGAYAALSLFNHSCNPNVTRNCYGSIVVQRALTNIKKGEQCFDVYGRHFAMTPKPERQKKLLEQYHFTCTCEPCTKNWPLYAYMPMCDDGWNEESIVDVLAGADLKVAKEKLGYMLKKSGEFEGTMSLRSFFNYQECVKQCYAIFGNVRKAW